MGKKVLLFIALLGVTLFGFGQPFTELLPKTRVGMTAAINYTMLAGSELKNPRPKTASALGFAVRQKLGKQLQMTAESNVSFSGSRFANGKTDSYYLMKFVRVNLPLSLMLNIDGENQKKFITAGIDGSYILRSEIYVRPNDVKPTFVNYGFKRFDLAATLGVHLDYQFFGIRPSIRMGLLNLNNGLKMENIFPATGNNGTIKHVGFDVQVYF
ncbi:MAG: outer membrane beta-barrel protein [Flavobacteriales bacterium]|nr:outer membrane beta-barrel protein [Flavobacteriales bacterium]